MYNNTPYTDRQQIYYVAAKSRVSYILLALFFGGMGIHDFYAGFVGKGLLKILISFLGIGFVFTGTVGALAVATGSTPPSDPEIALMPLLGFALLGFQSLYIIIQMCTVTQDAKGVPFI